MAKILSFFAVIVTVIAIFTTALAAISAPYRRKRTSWLLATGIIAYMLACCGIMVRAYLPRLYLYDNPGLARVLSLTIEGLNNLGILALLCGVAFYYTTEEDPNVAPVKIKRRKLSRNVRISFALGVATLIVALFPMISSLPAFQAYTQQPLLLRSPVVNHRDGYAMFGIKNFSQTPVHDVTATFHAYADSVVTFTPRNPNFRVKFETPHPLATPLERLISVEIGDLKPDAGVIVTISRNSSTNTNIWLKEPPERPFAEPKSLQAWHSTGAIPVTNDVRILQTDAGYGINYAIVGAWELSER